MKKSISAIAVLLMLTGCTATFDVDGNPDEENFDENYQGSSNIDLENAGQIDTPVDDDVEVADEEEATGTGDEITDTEETAATGTGEEITADTEEVDTATGETVVETTEEASTETGTTL